MNRRHFLGKTALAGLATLTGANAATSESGDGRELGVFTKFLETLPFDALAERLAPLGISGLEAPLRKGGHIEPSEMAEKLPAFVQALSQKNLKVLVMASSIDRVDKEGLAEKQLRAAAAAGIKRYRLQHLRYDLTRPIAPQIANFQAQLTDLAALNAQLGIQGLYQNHRGRDFVGGPIWDMVGILEEIDPQHLGLAFDFAHATVEGANAWEMNFLRARDQIGAVFFKDYQLKGKSWNACPLGQGAVNPKSGTLAALLPKEIPAILHVEYISPGDHAKMIDAMQTDLATLRKWLA